MSQQALVLESKQGPFVLSTRPIPAPGKGELLVKVRAAGLNPVDWKIQAYGVFIERFPAVLGSDIAGEVEGVGEGVGTFNRGDRVFFQGAYHDNNLGGFQRYAVIPAEIAGKIPANITYSQAASIPVTFDTAAIGLFGPKPIGAGLESPFDRKARYAGQPTVVIGGGASAGQFAIQLLKLAGFSPLIVYASARHTSYLTPLGATHVVDRATTPLAELRSAVQAITAAEIAVVFDSVGSKDAQQAGFDILAAGGTLVTVLPAAVPPTDAKRVLSVAGSVHPPTHRAFGRVIWEYLPGLVADGLVVPNRVEDLPGGLEGIVGGLDRLHRDEISGTKLIGLPWGTPA
ncbi:chaperonin 10-like protein [Mycena olivaceomarginata]|nr:chaperonin 10-like protein [Mycena olivaceomarginata]